MCQVRGCAAYHAHIDVREMFEVKSGRVIVPARNMGQLGAIEKAHRPAIVAAMAEQSSLLNELFAVQRHAAQR